MKYFFEKWFYISTNFEIYSIKWKIKLQNNDSHDALKPSLKYVHSCQRVPSPLFYENFLYCQSPFSNFVDSPQNLHFSFSYLVFWLNGWLCHIWCVIFHNDFMDLHLSSLGTIVQKDQQGINFTEVWHIMWFFTNTLMISHRHVHINKDPEHTHGLRVNDTAMQIYIYTTIYVLTAVVCITLN